ncbi:hypothetical protein KG088_01995 [Halomonas sp. TRM85114]|uniref:hypothetical protein n=1 Tax=Halomonas jincaotanensis TaxID=2810616 RepID=UPI001BD3B125|nr:hypothetical protein [Halomonas jincaotanensis]MBS9402392.1 hypothetical protein [Halomonas jincaotanensis]
MNAPRQKERLVALIVLAVALFSPPLLLLVDNPSRTGLSWLPLYVFIAWAAVIALAAWLMEQHQEE